MFEKGCEVPGEERVHVNPYTAIRPYDQQSNEIPIHPRFLIIQIQQAAPIERRSPRQHLNISHTQLECIWEPSEVLSEDRVNEQVSIGPHDQTGIIDVLGREKGFEHVFLSLTKRCEVDAPIGVIVDAVVGGYEHGVV